MINFFTTLNSQAQRSITHWYIFTLSLCAFTVIGCGIVTIQHASSIIK